MLKCGANVDKQDTEGRTALMAAAFMDHANIVSILLDNGADPNVSPLLEHTCTLYYIREL